MSDRNNFFGMKAENFDWFLGRSPDHKEEPPSEDKATAEKGGVGSSGRPGHVGGSVRGGGKNVGVPPKKIKKKV